MKKLIIGNWKLYVNSLSDGAKLLQSIDRFLPRNSKANIVVCPPTPLAVALRKTYGGKRILFGAQDAFWESEGAYTGAISPRALKDSGITHVIVGHAETRMRGDTNEIVSKKITAALHAGLVPVLCVGEDAQDSEGKHFTTLTNEITESLAGVVPASAGKIVIAYDPLWAIGQAEPADARAVAQSIIFIRKTLVDLWGREQAEKTRIIYGGSVDSAHAAAFAKEEAIQGLLPGRASVNAAEFCAIIKEFCR